MGVEDTTKTDTRTETSDKPAPQERPTTPPPDNPGSPGQPSRLESLRQAREHQEARSHRAQDKDTGSSPREQRDDKATTPEQTGSGSEKAETSGRPEAEDKQQRQDKDQREDDGRPGTDQPGRQDKRDDDPRSQDRGTTAGRETDTGTPGDRPQAQPAEPRADARAEPADRPSASQGRWTPPPDNPGSPGQPSRLESLARARELQQAAAAQRSEGENGREPSAEGGTGPVSAEKDNGRDSTQAATEPADTRREPEAPEPGPGEARRPDAYGEQPDPHDNGVQAGHQGQVGVPGDRDRPAEQAPGTSTDTGQPPTRDFEPLSQQDGAQSQHAERPAEQPPDSEQSRQDRPVHDDPLAERPESGLPNDDRPGATDTQANPANETTDQNTEPARDADAHGDRSSDQPAGDNAPRSPEEPVQNQGTAESLDERDGDRGKKAEELETTEPGSENNTPDRTPHQSGESEEPGTELAPQEANTTEVEEPRRFDGRIRIAFDSDRRPIPASRDNGNDTADRGELQRPEDDPADRNPLEPDPERPRSPRDLRREMMRAGPDFRKDINETAKPALAQFDSQPPKTQPCVARNVSSHIESFTPPVKAGDAVVGVVGGIIVATELLRIGIGAIKR
ncbi:hypothetical protein ACN3XK_39600 [Actinomadura welshii]